MQPLSTLTLAELRDLYKTNPSDWDHLGIEALKSLGLPGLIKQEGREFNVGNRDFRLRPFCLPKAKSPLPGSMEILALVATPSSEYGLVAEWKAIGYLNPEGLYSWEQRWRVISAVSKRALHRSRGKVDAPGGYGLGPDGNPCPVLATLFFQCRSELRWSLRQMASFLDLPHMSVRKVSFFEAGQTGRVIPFAAWPQLKQAMLDVNTARSLHLAEEIDRQALSKLTGSVDDRKWRPLVMVPFGVERSKQPVKPFTEEELDRMIPKLRRKQMGILKGARLADRPMFAKPGEELDELDESGLDEEEEIFDESELDDDDAAPTDRRQG